MTWIDLFIIGIVVVSSLISVMRGFVKEALSLAAWVAAFVIAWRFNGGMVSFLQGFIANKNLQFIVGFIFLFILTLLVFAIVTFIILSQLDFKSLSYLSPFVYAFVILLLIFTFYTKLPRCHTQYMIHESWLAEAAKRLGPGSR